MDGSQSKRFVLKQRVQESSGGVCTRRDGEKKKKGGRLRRRLHPFPGIPKLAPQPKEIQLIH